MSVCSHLVLLLFVGPKLKPAWHYSNPLCLLFICCFMMVVVLFQLIFLNKTKSSSCRDLPPNRPFQELNLYLLTFVLNVLWYEIIEKQPNLLVWWSRTRWYCLDLLGDHMQQGPACKRPVPLVTNLNFKYFNILHDIISTFFSTFSIIHLFIYFKYN